MKEEASLSLEERVVAEKKMKTLMDLLSGEKIPLWQLIKLWELIAEAPVILLEQNLRSPLVICWLHS